MRLTPLGWVVGGLMLVGATIAVAKWVVIIHYIIEYWHAK